MRHLFRRQPAVDPATKSYPEALAGLLPLRQRQEVQALPRAQE